METFWHDVRHGLRVLAKNPGFTLVAVLTLTLAIGANVAIFTVVDGVLLRPLPFHDAGQLVRIFDDLRGPNLQDVGMSQPELQDLRYRSGVFQDISAVWPVDSNITGTAHPERVESLITSPVYFSLLGAQPQLGRVFGPQDEMPGFAEGAVISDGLWHRMYGGAPDILGRKLLLDGDLYTIIGVMPPAFRHPGRTLSSDVDLWGVAGFAADPFPPPDRKIRLLPQAIGRLRAGLTIEQAQAQLDAFAAHLREQYPNDYAAAQRWSPRLVPLQEDLVGKSRKTLLILLAAVGFILLIGCVNIANLLLARASARGREVAIRLALGAGRWRLVRQMLTESVLLAIMGGTVALLFTVLLKSLLLRLIPQNIPRLNEASFSGGVIAFAFGITLLAGILFGLVPALQSSRPHLQENLREGSRGSGTGGRQNRFRSALVVTEFALSFVLMIGAGLLLRSFWSLLRVDLGFSSSQVVVARTWIPVRNDPAQDPYTKPEARTAFFREVLRRVKNIPGVQEAAIGSPSSIPLIAQRTGRPFEIEGRPAASGPPPITEAAIASPGYFHLLRTPLMRGRDFTEHDDNTVANVVVIDQPMVDRFWPNADPLGQRIRFGPRAPWMTIVGVVGRMKTDTVDAAAQPHIYVPTYQFGNNGVAILVRTTASPSAMEQALRREVQSVDPGLPVFGVRTLDDVVSDSLAQRRFAMQLLGLFAAVALLLAGIGIYGVISYSVNQRVHEIGVRVALGAQRAHIFNLILRQGVMLSAAGVLCGLLGATMLTRFLGSLLFGVSSTDPLTFIAISFLLTLVALAACYVPARRAMRVDPIVALRYE